MRAQALAQRQLRAGPARAHPRGVVDAASHGLRALPEVRLEQLSDADSRLGRDLLSTGLDRSADRGRARLIDDLRHERLFARWARVPRLLPMPSPARDIYLL
jgi:hypothetical protein